MLCNMSTDDIRTLRFFNGRPSADDAVISASGNTVCINIDKNAVIRLDMLFDGDHASDISINLNDGAEAYIIEDYSSSNPVDISAKCSVTMGKGSTLKHQIINFCPFLSMSYNLKAEVSENSIYANYQSHLGGISACGTEINLTGYSSSASSQLIAFTGDSQKQNHDLRVNHLAKNTRSRVMNHGAALGKSGCNINCVGYIEKGMSGSDAYQKSRIITLSDEAKAHVSPALLIDEYDVSAGHSGSVGSIDSSALYYLQSRGIEKSAAVAMCTAGFLLGAADHNNEELYARIEERIKEIIQIQ